jgi:catechol 2,3-dioxygenase-like lactoylglutathione lyase family enzyme
MPASTTTDRDSLIAGGLPTIFITDMDRAVRFYTETLGLGLVHRAGEQFAMIDAGRGVMIGLHPPSDSAPKPGTPGAIQLGLNVTRPIEQVVAELQSRGVAFHRPGSGETTTDTPIVDDGAVKLAFLNDPDGNELYLCESQS